MITYRVVNLAISEAAREKVDVQKNLGIPEKKTPFAAIRPRIGLRKPKNGEDSSDGLFWNNSTKRGKTGTKRSFDTCKFMSLAVMIAGETP